MNLVTLVPSGASRFKKALLLKLIAMARLDAFIRSFRGGQKRGPGPGELIESLNFIHFGRWVLIAKPWWRWGGQGLPRLDRKMQPKEKIGESVLLFTSNFNNDWGSYVGTFVDAALDDLGALWDQTPGWKRPTDRGIQGFLGYVEEHAMPSDHFFAAYPNLPTADLKAALAVDRGARSFRLRMAALELQGTPLTDDKWCIAFDRLVASLQHNIGKISSVNVNCLFGQSPNRFGDQNVAITSLSPVPIASVSRIRSRLADLTKGTGSPFSRVHGTHFARLVLIDKVPDHCRINKAKGIDQWVDLESAYLTLSVDADGSSGGLDAWLADMYRAFSSFGGADLIAELWSDCYGYTSSGGAAGFVSYIKKTMFPATVPFADYPRTSLWDIDRAVTLHNEFTNMLFGSLDLDCKARRAAFDAVPMP